MITKEKELEIARDIAECYKKIDQCYKSKSDLESKIAEERAMVISLSALIKEDSDRVSLGKKPRYEAESMMSNIDRCDANIQLFKETIDRETDNVSNFLNIIGILREDMQRPTEVFFDASKRH